MSKYDLDFAEIKRNTTYEKAAQLLELKVKRTKPNQVRGPCPCDKGGDRALCLTEGEGFYCWGSHIGGGVIDLVMHVRKCTQVEAAKFLKGTVSTSSTSTSTVPESDGGSETKKFAPLSYLEHDHPAIKAVGFDPEIAKELGIGYAPRGILRGTVAVPVRYPNGDIAGYIGIEEARLPPTFMGKNVFALKSA